MPASAERSTRIAGRRGGVHPLLDRPRESQLLIALERSAHLREVLADRHEVRDASGRIEDGRDRLCGVSGLSPHPTTPGKVEGRCLRRRQRQEATGRGRGFVAPSHCRSYLWGFEPPRTRCSWFPGVLATRYPSSFPSQISDSTNLSFTLSKTSSVSVSLSWRPRRVMTIIATIAPLESFDRNTTLPLSTSNS